MKKQLSCLLVLILVLFTACGTPAEAPVATPPALAPTAPATPGVLSAFTATDLDGNAVDQSILSDYDITAVNIWATFCGPCKDDLPHLADLQAQYQDKGLQIIGLVTDVVDYEGATDPDQIAVAKELLEASGGTYLNLVPSDNLMATISANVPILGTPTTFFVDSSGNRIGKLYSGKQNKDGWIAIFDDLLAQESEAEK